MLPPHHCDLNPTELTWSQLKGLMRHRSQCRRLEALEKLPLPCSDEITPQLWERCCRHVEQLENDYWVKDGLLDDLDPVVVNVGSDSDSAETKMMTAM